VYGCDCLRIELWHATRPNGLQTPKAAGIPPLLWLSSALVPPVLTETITPSYPVVRQQIRTPRTVLNASLGQGQGEANQLGIQGCPTMASKDAQLWHKGLQGWRSKDTQRHPRPPPGQYAVKGTVCHAPSSAGYLRTSMEATWYQRGT